MSLLRRSSSVSLIRGFLYWWFHRTVHVCDEGEVRLVDSNTDGSGRVEVCLNREWMIVGDSSWGVEEATVICRQLGLPTYG